MVKLLEIERTATFGWSPGSHVPLIASGTVAGAVNADFSDLTQLEIWDLNLMNSSVDGSRPKLLGSVQSSARYRIE